jgi:hypothetical protein
MTRTVRSIVNDGLSMIQYDVSIGIGGSPAASIRSTSVYGAAA